jgi:23S rRNA (guanosine2251-2'-O)-methyltransferase
VDKEFLYGRHPVMRALDNPRRPKQQLYFQDGLPPSDDLDALRMAAVRQRIAVETLPKVALEKRFSLSGRPHQGVVLVAGPVEYVDLETLLDQALHADTPALVVVLDHVHDPHNFGAILRTASLAGAHGVVIPKDRAVGITPAVVKTSAGASEMLPVSQVTNLNRALEQIKNAGIWVTGIETGGGQTIYDVDFRGHVAIVAGNEDAGIARLTREKCDFIAEIPMHSDLESLNVSVATAVTLFEVVRQRR